MDVLEQQPADPPRVDPEAPRVDEARGSAPSGPEPPNRPDRERLDLLCAAAEKAAASDAVGLAAAERQLRTVRQALEELQAPGSPRRPRPATVRRLRRAQVALLRRVRELRDFADWRQWANLGVRENLCAEMEALADCPDDARLAARYGRIMSRWRLAADVPKDRGEQLRARFEAAHGRVYSRRQAHLAAQSADRERNLERRLAIVEEVERLASSTDWLKTVQRITELQAQWKEIGPVPRRRQQETWDRFRAACGRFFARRKEDLAGRKQEWARNLERKEALIARVEALSAAAETEIAGAVEQARQAQAEWKEIGPVQRKRSEAVRQRFQAVCDAVLNRAQAAERASAADRIKACEALCGEVEALLPAAAGGGEPPGRVAEALRDIQRRWRQAPDVPPAERRRLATRFGQAVGCVVTAHPDAFHGTDLDPSRRLKRLEDLCRQVETIADSQSPPEASPAEILAARWRDALASNLMGARVDEASRRRSALDQVKRLQAEHRRLGPLAGVDAEALLSRFQRACDRAVRGGRADRAAS